MALVAYSDSEGSDNEDPAQPAPSSAKPTITKSLPGKIKVELPSFRAEPGQEDGASQPPAKRARTSGTFSGFNDLLPAPKRAATQASGLKKGVSLKTSSEAAFSRVAPSASEAERTPNAGESEYEEFGNRKAGTIGSVGTEKAVNTDNDNAVKMVGKATRFRPLSVANNRKKAVKKKAATPSGTEPAEAGRSESDPAGQVQAVAPAASVAKPKRSLFSVQHEEVAPVEEAAEDAEVLVSEPTVQHLQPEPTQSPRHAQPSASNSLDAVASDLNLSAADRRQLFGRKGGKGANITHFNLDREYRANEQLRQAGETIDHKAVKAIAPGKHSLQQLVNNARSNQEGIEDKWAEGRRARGEGGSKYGWGK
ncbi:hypothetical protein EJ03DRAFT_330409 [Teratosphaeria nubilosa]|uniref:Mitotic checkpoint regulator, MAD2B-interacting-domain-containing protein n=1 Tax=Teratosphaeria nubilosa TaxID=161662 RepID=A0A6G1L0R6_9PEZI|nr:hypothetical protein EJ03DRAFT_330409 [Teratosphaeria nubilosa]